jgi:O-antigen/teichoic acid export membrane protein
MPFTQSQIWQRLRRWFLLATTTLFLQGLSQGMGFITGLLLARQLTMADFGRYAIYLTVLGTCSVLADIGVMNAVSALGGRAHADRARVAEILNCAMFFRRRFEALAFLIGLPMLCYLLHQVGTPLVETLLASLALLLGVHGQVLSDIFSLGPVLYLRADQAQRVTVIGSVARFLSILVALFVFHSVGFVLTVMGVSLIVQGQLMKRVAHQHIPTRPGIRAEDRAAVAEIIRHGLVGALYYAFMPQLTMLLISWFGNAARIAEVGALGRLGLIFTAVSALIANLVVPRFARLQAPGEVLIRYLQSVGAVAAVALGLFLLAASFSHQLLWLLGPKYSHLSNEFVLLVGAAALNLVVVCMASLNNCRAWVRKSWMFVVSSIAIQVLLIKTLDVSTTRGAILFGWGPLISSFVGCAVLAWVGLSREWRQASAGDAAVTPAR